MDDLYSHLDNYEDVHALEELRAENKELKEKLAENSSAMAKLQKDYDNLEMAFKTLEHNYSSLLITARAELQRKSQRINQLNTEKDLMVLDAFKSGRNIRRKFNTGIKNPGRMKEDKPWNVNKKTNEDNVKQKDVAVKQERREMPVLPKKDADPDLGIFNQSKPDNTGVKLQMSNRRKSNVNDNIAQPKTEINGPPKTTASSIKDRRKSTPAVSMPMDTFSSSDEQERNYPTKETRTDHEMRNISQLPIDRNQTSETSSVEDRGHKHYESPRDTFKSRPSRYHDKSSYRGSKDDVFVKYRKQHGPERGLKRPHREHLDAYPKQLGEHLDDRFNQHKDCLDNMQSREHKLDYPRQSREYKDDYPKQHREHPDDQLKQHREHPDDHLKQHRERLDDRQYRDQKHDYTRQFRESKDDYPKQHREHPDVHLKQQRECLDDRQFRDQKHDYPPRQLRGFKEGYPRQEHGRFSGRSLESPPLESYSRNQRTKSAYRPYDRYPHDQDKNKYHHDDKYSAKYRSKDSDEPLIKRQRRELHGNSNVQNLDSRKPYRGRESVDPQPTPDFSPHEEDMLRFSCQSPDYVHNESDFDNPIKEIMATAATPLDDPRVTSQRYVIQNENGKETLSTVVGRNIDIIPVNKVGWRLKPMDMPVALVRRPSQSSDLLLKDIYMDIDNPVNNPEESMESGELCETGDEIRKIRKQPSEHNMSMQPGNTEAVSKPNIAKYRIPKIQNHSNMDVPIIDLGENVPHHKNVNNDNAGGDNVPKELLPHKQQYNKRDDFMPDSKNNSKLEDRKKSKSRERSESRYQSTLTKMAIVADDLELSDDTSDHTDTNKRVVSGKDQKHCEMSLHINKARSIDSLNTLQNEPVASSLITEIKSTVNTAGVTDDEKAKESDITKKQKTKKKKSKSKEIFKDAKDSTADPVHVLEKKSKSKKEKEKESITKETKEKFSDLFGDSNSLMTPEDLGIPSYLSISEDTQDAVDMKINQMIDGTPLVDKDEIPGHILPPKRVEVLLNKQLQLHKTTAPECFPTADLQKSSINVEDKEVIHEIKKNSSSKTNEDGIDTHQLPSPIVYENLNPGANLNDPNVVKTVIISTGVQPEIAYENKTQVTKPDTVVNVNTIDCIPATTEFKKDILKALATSTPHKEFSAMNSLEADKAKPDINSDPCVSQAVATITNVEPVVNQTENNTLESNDAPDIRIFVKRRRKIVKRPPMN